METARTDTEDKIGRLHSLKSGYDLLVGLACRSGQDLVFVWALMIELR